MARMAGFDLLRVSGSKQAEAPPFSLVTGGGAPFHYVTPEAGWDPYGHLGYYLHQGRVYWQGGVFANSDDASQTILTFPADIAPASPVTFTAWVDVANADDAQSPSFAMVVSPAGTISFDDSSPIRYPERTLTGVILHGLSWEIVPRADDPGAFTDLAAFIPFVGPFEPTQVDAEAAAHNNRLHLRGSLLLHANGHGDVLSLPAAEHEEWQPGSFENPAPVEQALGNDQMTFMLPVDGCDRPIQGFATKVTAPDRTALVVQSMFVRKTIHLSFATGLALDALNSSFLAPTILPAEIGCNSYNLLDGSPDPITGTGQSVHGNFSVPLDLPDDYGQDPTAENLGVFIGLIGPAYVTTRIYKAVYTRSGHFDFLRVWAVDTTAPSGTGPGERYRFVVDGPVRNWFTLFPPGSPFVPVPVGLTVGLIEADEDYMLTHPSAVGMAVAAGGFGGSGGATFNDDFEFEEEGFSFLMHSPPPAQYVSGRMFFGVEEDLGWNDELRSSLSSTDIPGGLDATDKPVAIEQASWFLGAAGSSGALEAGTPAAGFIRGH